jgi:hypothetical protein
MMQNDIDPDLRDYFKDCVMPVDVFHFKLKHKETDIDCNRHCNPYIWLELHNGEKWWFNSSAAEQSNVRPFTAIKFFKHGEQCPRIPDCKPTTSCGYQAIVHEMEADCFESFLDEMIKHRNWLINNLRIASSLHTP